LSGDVSVVPCRLGSVRQLSYVCAELGLVELLICSTWDHCVLKFVLEGDDVLHVEEQQAGTTGVGRDQGCVEKAKKL
jgi:hypothetical protein